MQWHDIYQDNGNNDDDEEGKNIHTKSVLMR